MLARLYAYTARIMYYVDVLIRFVCYVLLMLALPKSQTYNYNYFH